MKRDCDSAACCWPEQEAVESWLEDYGLNLPFETVQDLKDRVTRYRIEVQRERDGAEEKFDKLLQAAETVAGATETIVIQDGPLTATYPGGKSLYDALEDLKQTLETVRGVHNYGRFLIRDCGDDETFTLLLVDPQSDEFHELYEGTYDECVEEADKLGGIIDRIVEAERDKVTIRWEYNDNYTSPPLDFDSSPGGNVIDYGSSGNEITVDFDPEGSADTTWLPKR